MSESRTILIVDDDVQVLQVFRKILERGGYRVLATKSGEDALEIVRKEPVNLVVLDISMPEPDGFEMLKRLRDTAAGLRVLAVSGYMGGTLLEAAQVFGATATLNKQDAPTSLLSTVNNLLKW